MSYGGGGGGGNFLLARFISNSKWFVGIYPKQDFFKPNCLARTSPNHFSNRAARPVIGRFATSRTRPGIVTERRTFEKV